MSGELLHSDQQFENGFCARTRAIDEDLLAMEWQTLADVLLMDFTGPG